jgi:hypothetical protein
MIYEIQSKSDFSTGTSLTVKIPKGDLDKNALHTIIEDRPEFILPFHYRIVDDEVELVYQIGLLSKLQYFSGTRSPKEYAELWLGILSPLLDCGDWFMKPYSFVLDADYLYYDKGKQTVGYVYIPSLRECSDYDALRGMAIEFSSLISITDPVLENKVLRALMKDFSPAGFLKMIKPYSAATLVPAEPRYAADAADTGAAYMRARENPDQGYGQDPGRGSWATGAWGLGAGSAAAGAAGAPGAAGAASYRASEEYGADMQDSPASRTVADDADEGGDDSGDSFFSFPVAGNAAKKAFGRLGGWDFPGGKKGKDKETAKAKGNAAASGLGGWFARWRDESLEDAPEEQVEYQKDSDEMRGNPAASLSPAEIREDTENVVCETGGARLRFIGSASLPAIINVRVPQGEAFTIGRFDASVGRQQSSFEFDKKTKGVSRRHAAIECRSGIYTILDLASSAGTFINGQKLPPNMPVELSHGIRVSFGNSGANYVWEE